MKRCVLSQNPFSWAKPSPSPSCSGRAACTTSESCLRTAKSMSGALLSCSLETCRSTTSCTPSSVTGRTRNLTDRAHNQERSRSYCVCVWPCCLKWNRCCPSWLTCCMKKMMTTTTVASTPSCRWRWQWASAKSWTIWARATGSTPEPSSTRAASPKSSVSAPAAATTMGQCDENRDFLFFLCVFLGISQRQLSFLLVRQGRNRAGQAASTLLQTMWKHADLHSVYKKVSFYYKEQTKHIVEPSNNWHQEEMEKFFIC